MKVRLTTMSSPKTRFVLIAVKKTFPPGTRSRADLDTRSSGYGSAVGQSHPAM
jgi:hypothetical protein